MSRSPPGAGGARPVTFGALLRAIDWRLLLLFVGLFVVIGAIEQAGIDRQLFLMLQPFRIETNAGLSATAAVLSNTISNVPAVMLFTRVVPRFDDPRRAWLVLAMASTSVAAQPTILGSIANLIVVEGAARRGIAVSSRPLLPARRSRDAVHARLRRLVAFVTTDRHLAWKLRVVLEERLLVLQSCSVGCTLPVDVGHARDQRVLAGRGAVPGVGEQLPGVLLLSS